MYRAYGCNKFRSLETFLKQKNIQKLMDLAWNQGKIVHVYTKNS